MSNYYSDPTANAAISTVDKELKVMQKRAAQIKNLRRNGRLTAEEEAEARKQFIGLYKRLLQDALAG